MATSPAHFLFLDDRSETYGTASNAILRAYDNYASRAIINPVHDKPGLTLHVVVNAARSAGFCPCENCGGEGGFPEPHGEWGLCPACEGTGEVASSDRELISLDDLDRIDREKPADAYVDH